MSQLLFWTAAEPGLITKTFGASLRSFRPNVPPHQFVKFVEGKLIEPGEGDVVLCCGVKALDALRVAGVYPKNRIARRVAGEARQARRWLRHGDVRSRRHPDRSPRSARYSIGTCGSPIVC